MRGATEAHQPGRAELGPPQRRRRRRDRHHLARAPRQHRALAAAVPPRRGAKLARRAGRRPRPGHPRGVREAARPAHEARRVHAGLERARHRHAGARDDRDGAPPRRRRAGRRRAGGLAHAGRRAGARLRLLRASPATRCSRPTGIGVLFGKRGGARGDAAVAGRRQHDQRRHLREDRATSRRPALRGRHRQHRRRGRPGRGARLRCSALGIENIARYEHELLDYAHRAARPRSRACA